MADRHYADTDPRAPAATCPYQEIAQLLARIEQLEKQCETNCDLLREAYAETAKVKSDTEAACKRLTADNQRLACENAGLREDRERLDWLECNCLIAKQDGAQKWTHFTPSDVDNDDLRVAIDAARGGK